MIFDTKKSKSYVLGYDLSDSFCQISYLSSDSDMPQTLSVLAGAELYNIPTVLSKEKGTSNWYYGKEAQKRIEENGDIEVRGLIEKAGKMDMIEVDGTEYNPVALLSLFIKKSLSLLSMEMSMELVKAIVFTARDLDDKMIEALSAVVENLGLDSCDIFYQSYEESLYYYMLYQTEDLKRQNVVAVSYDFGRMYVYMLRYNRGLSPIVSCVDTSYYDDLALADPELPTSQEKIDMMDEQLSFILRHLMENTVVNSVYLLGNGFRSQWMHKSLKFLCTGRRVFLGNNLFSKGASIAAREKISPSSFASDYVFLRKDKLFYNVGMLVDKSGKEVYHALLDAGISWYDAAASISVILDKKPELKLIMTSVIEGTQHEELLELKELPQRPERTTRLRIDLKMKSEEILTVYVEDQGFGEIFPASGITWSLDVPCQRNIEIENII